MAFIHEHHLLIPVAAREALLRGTVDGYHDKQSRTSVKMLESPRSVVSAIENESRGLSTC